MLEDESIRRLWELDDTGYVLAAEDCPDGLGFANEAQFLRTLAHDQGASRSLDSTADGYMPNLDVA